MELRPTSLIYWEQRCRGTADTVEDSTSYENRSERGEMMFQKSKGHIHVVSCKKARRSKSHEIYAPWVLLKMYNS